ncbi:MAG: alpha/beta hydrolase [Verrucomicrobiales bacterium]|nr:alpha/beta hydrolase [Verrucomicrobiales bacterium]
MKTPLLHFGLSILTAFFFTTSSSAEPLLTGEAPKIKSYPYKTSANVPRKMEVYFPPGHDPSKSKVPGLILFHGGGWAKGSLDQFRDACAYFASRGLVCATAEYRMLTKKEAKALPDGETRKRACIIDAKSAIRWYKENASELGIDPERIITGGGSAGGHISTLATLNPGLNDPADPKGFDTGVVAYLLFNPAYSDTDEKDPQVDVLRHLTPSMAPAIVFFGDDDKWKAGFDTAYAKLRKLGNTSMELHLAEGQGHSFFNKEPWKTVTLLAADRFLIKEGLLSGEPTLDSPETGEALLHES